jgi:hypothetical protein
VSSAVASTLRRGGGIAECKMARGARSVYWSSGR